MENRSLLQSFAMDKDDRMRSVDEVARGLACECVCPCCGDRVLARQGEVREWHFAHASGSDCDHAAEGALHLAAKQVLLDSGGMSVPEIRVPARVTLPDGRTGYGEAVRQSAWIDFQSVEPEKGVGTIRPDVVAIVDESMFFIEVAVTHFIDDEKRAVLRRMEIPTVEIDLAATAKDKWTWDLLKDLVIESTEYKSWMHVADRAALKQEAREAALTDANAKQLPVVPELPTAPTTAAPRTRFWIGPRMVDVIERPFGLAVWSPYDPALNQVIKSLIRPMGGRWQAKFKNWLVPLGAKDWLFGALCDLSGKPPERKV